MIQYLPSVSILLLIVVLIIYQLKDAKTLVTDTFTKYANPSVNTINLQQFKKMAVDLGLAKDPNNISIIFRVIDKDNSKFLNKEEFENAYTFFKKVLIGLCVLIIGFIYYNVSQDKNLSNPLSSLLYALVIGLPIVFLFYWSFSFLIDIIISTCLLLRII